jgi:hypothetical protein
MPTQSKPTPTSAQQALASRQKHSSASGELRVSTGAKQETAAVNTNVDSDIGSPFHVEPISSEFERLSAGGEHVTGVEGHHGLDSIPFDVPQRVGQCTKPSSWRQSMSEGLQSAGRHVRGTLDRVSGRHGSDNGRGAGSSKE